MTAREKPTDNSSQRDAEAGGAPRAGAGRRPPPRKLTPHARETGDGDAGMAAKFPRYRMVKTEELLPYENNARTHSDAQIAKIVRSIREFGFTNPILTDGDAGVIAGHGRLLAAQQLGLETVPTIELKHLTPAQRKAYVIADNKLALDAGWDMDLLRIEMGDLRDMAFDLDLTGFDPMEVDKLFGPAGGNTDPDDVPEVQAEAVTVTGDVWLLGRHWLVCGDCLDVLPTLTGVDAVVTDPPYGIINKFGQNTAADGGVRTLQFPWDGEHVNANVRSACQLTAGLGNAQFWFCGLEQAAFLAEEFRGAGLTPKAAAWVKECPPPAGKGNWWPSGFELAVYAYRSGAWFGDKNPKRSNVFVSDSYRHGQPGKEDHPTQKPIGLIERLVESIVPPSGVVLDPFSGSGTTIIAAEMTGRACHAIEIAPQYVDVAIRRWQAFAGAAATLEGDGRTFAEVERARLAVPA